MELQLLPLAQGCRAAYRMASPGREGAGHDRVDAPTQEGGTNLESEAGREGRKHQLNFLEANPVRRFWHCIAAADAGMDLTPQQRTQTAVNTLSWPVLTFCASWCSLPQVELLLLSVPKRTAGARELPMRPQGLRGPMI